MEQPQTANVPPQNLDAERSVLGAMMVSASSLDPVFADVRLTADDFYRERHRVVYDAIKSLYERDQAVDALTVTEFLTQNGRLDAAGGQAEVESLPDQVPAPGNSRHYAAIVKQNSLLRRLLAAAQQIQQSVHGREGEPQQLAEQAERLLFDAAHREQAGDFVQLGDILMSEVTRLEKLAAGDSSVTGTTSGFKELDAITGGFQPGNLIVLAARPGMGKSGWAINVADHVAREMNKPVALFSLEMSEMEIAQRLIATRARFPSDKLRKGKVGAQDWKRVLRAGNELEQARLWIDDSSDLGMLDLRAKARRLHASESAGDGEGLALIILDYLQLMRADDPRANRVEQVGQMSRGLKILARELEVQVLALSQLSRAPEQRTGRDKHPILSALRESGNIEQDADIVAFIYREDYYEDEPEEPGVAELILRKNRHGPTDTVKLAFKEPYASFINYHPGEDRQAAPRSSEGSALDVAEDG
ncbi:MAG: replicative DNA helicase [Solirubrobacterales bacterium]